MKNIPVYYHGEIYGYAKVDDDDYEELTKMKWSCTEPSKGYFYIRSNSTWLHRKVTAAPFKSVVDHINGDTFDNRKANLRICSHEENLRNGKVHSNNTSGYKGVCYHKGHKRWIAKICRDKKQLWLGDFDTELEAAYAYNDAAKEFHGEFAHLNNLPEKSP